MIFKERLKKILRPNGKVDFLCRLSSRAEIFDVGCGNNSASMVRSILPDAYYVGIDICDQSRSGAENQFIVTSSENFTAEILKFNNRFDAVISSHNIEHCEDRFGTLRAMLAAVKAGGSIFLSFPCEESISFPSRDGTLNYFDDPTHKGEPPKFDDILGILEECDFEVIFARKNYKPFALRIIGLLSESFSRRRRKIMIGTWECYGFESVVIARKQL